MAPFTMRAGMMLIHGVAWFVSARHKYFDRDEMRILP
jgi:hypothetical protein